MTPSFLASVALVVSPFVALLLLAKQRNVEALAIVFLGALLLLPTGVSLKIEMIPELDKNSVPTVAALLGCILFFPRPKTKLRFGMFAMLSITFILSPLFTSILNSDPIFLNDIVIPGVGWYDGVSAVLRQIIAYMPFYLAYRYVRKSDDLESVLRVSVLAGLLYILPMLIELRFTPQLAMWIYGYFPSSFAVEARFGGYRPVVFMKNGLTLAFFMATVLLAAIALFRIRRRIYSVPLNIIVLILSVTLLLCKSVGASVYAVALGPIVWMTNPRTQLHIAVLLATVALAYPMLRMSDMFPREALVDIAAAAVNPDRAASLQFRFDAEQKLLEHASKRFAFGWGRYGRNRVYDFDTQSDHIVTDGFWITTFGQFGFIGFIATFGLLSLPVFAIWRASPNVKSRDEGVLIAIFALIVSLGIVEQLPNSSVSAWTWLLAGALLGRAVEMKARSARGYRAVALEGAEQQATAPLGKANRVGRRYPP